MGEIECDEAGHRFGTRAKLGRSLMSTRAASAGALTAADRCGLPFVAAVLAAPPDPVVTGLGRDRPWIKTAVAIRVPVCEELGANGR